MACKVRYLLFFQYYGTKYSGVMKVPASQAVLGVQNYLEMALQKLRIIGTPTIYVSSRTDSGVHALCNSAHVDIERPPGKHPFSEAVLVQALNFHLKPERISSLDIEKIHEAAQILLGTHDFSAFRSINSETPFKSPIKTLEQADFTASSSLLPFDSQNSDVRFWNVTFKSNSYVYKQVRRMTGALVAVGLGLLTPQQIKFHLETGEQMSYSRSLMAPPDGLFLKEVKYAETDLKMDKASS
ncbi:tRNA pseudouridine synthase-like 1 isoform X2 [Lithobates pipiens]